MLRIVQQATIPDNEKLYQRAIEEAQLALRRAVAARVPRDGSFGDQEVALLAAANDVCRLELQTTLQAMANAQPERVQIDGTVYTRHEAGSAEYHSLCGFAEYFAISTCNASPSDISASAAVVHLDSTSG
jgi:hypothetical protein